MYYHVIIETNEKIGKTKRYEKLYDYDIDDLDKIQKEIIIPYKNSDSFQFKGYFLEPSKIRRIAIKSSELKIGELRDIQQDKVSSGVLFFWTREKIVDSDNITKDITSDVFNHFQSNESINNETIIDIDKSKVFIVHGHDETMKLEVARFIEKLGFEAIILHEQVNSGLTIIEKIEKFSNVGFGIVLYSPCDVGSENKVNAKKKLRARQNVIFEHGYLIAKLSRTNVCALVKDDIELPGDISGVIYINYDDSSWIFKVAQELKNAEYNVDMNKLTS